MSLEELKRRLRTGLNYDESAVPEEASIRIFHPTQNQAKGWVGEDGLARIAARRGEIILDVGSGIEQVNQGGPDLVTLAERPDGQLVVRFYDNKAFAGDDNISRVSALEHTFERNRALYESEWKRFAADESRPAAERELCARAAELIKDPTSYDRVVANWLGRSEDLTRALKDRGIIFEDLRLPERVQSIVSAETRVREQASESPFMRKATEKDTDPAHARVDVTEDSTSPFQRQTVGVHETPNGSATSNPESPFSRTNAPSHRAGEVGTTIDPRLTPKAR